MTQNVYVPAPNMCRDLSTHWKQAAVFFTAAT